MANMGGFPRCHRCIHPPQQKNDTFAVNNARLELFAKKQRSYEAVPPTLDALMEHTKRAVYQGGHVWGQTLECFQ